MSLDPFTILGVKQAATDEEIKTAYRLRMSMVHPDKFPSGSSQWQEANRMAGEINDAYQQIKTQEARRAFQARRNPSPPTQPKKTHPAPDRSQWKPAYKVRQEERARAAEWMRKQEEELEEIRRERAADQAAWLAKHPWTREWRKVRQAFEKNKAATIYGAIILALALFTLIRYGAESLLWGVN